MRTLDLRWSQRSRCVATTVRDFRAYVEGLRARLSISGRALDEMGRQHVTVPPVQVPVTSGQARAAYDAGIAPLPYGVDTQRLESRVVVPELEAPTVVLPTGAAKYWAAALVWVRRHERLFLALALAFFVAVVWAVWPTPPKKPPTELSNTPVVRSPALHAEPTTPQRLPPDPVRAAPAGASPQAAPTAPVPAAPAMVDDKAPRTGNVSPGATKPLAKSVRPSEPATNSSDVKLEAPSAAPAVESGGWSTRTWIGVTGVGLTAIAAGAGLGFRLKAGSLDREAVDTAAEAQRTVGPAGCSPDLPACQAVRAKYADRDSATSTATVAFVVAGVLGAATIAVLVWPSSDQRSVAGLHIVPDWGRPRAGYRSGARSSYCLLGDVNMISRNGVRGAALFCLACEAWACSYDPPSCDHWSSRVAPTRPDSLMVVSVEAQAPAPVMAPAGLPEARLEWVPATQPET